MVTGRVSCNTFGIFSDDGIKETLEVWFRLTKVDTFTQEQFVKSVHAYTALSRLLPGGFDASAWSNFVNAHPQLLERSFAPAPLQIQAARYSAIPQETTQEPSSVPGVPV